MTGGGNNNSSKASTISNAGGESTVAAVSTASQAVINKLESIISLEESFIKAPLEQYRKSFRQAQKIVERDLCTTLVGQLKDLAGSVAKGAKQPADSIPTIVQRLTQLKRKYEMALQEQQTYCQRTLRRLSHLNDLSTAMIPSSVSSSATPLEAAAKVENEKENDGNRSNASSSTATVAVVAADEGIRRWNRKMIDRLLVDYMLRRGYFRTVQKVIASDSLAENGKDGGVFYDYELFETASQIEKSLAAKSCTECLAWCSDNKSALRKKGSTLEFNLRLQEFIELVRARQVKEAIVYARKYLVSWADTLMPNIQEAMALIAFPPFTKCDKYRKLYFETRWQDLVLQFKRENFDLYSLPAVPSLSLKLQAGLSALKTPMCFQCDNKNVNCPVCNDLFGSLAQNLPLSHHINSCIVCRITGEIMNEDNPPLMMPNGHVYSTKAMREMASRNDGNVKCPRSNAIFAFTELRKCYIS